MKTSGRRSVAFLVLGVLCARTLTESAHAAAGRTAGTFAVSPSGAATYAIPIFAPRGPAGLQPNIALVYNSQSGNGYIGVGWNLSGLSSIYRCNLTYAQDAAPAPISLSSSDRYCLDGQRLRLVSGAYGADGSTYQTEIANFALVTAHGAAGNGPASFTVQTRDGRTLQYGNGSNSQVIANGTSTALTWMLNEVSDRSGNTMTISYSTINALSAVVPSTISWTPTSAGATSYSYTMNFSYDVNQSTAGRCLRIPDLPESFSLPVCILNGYVAGAPIQEGSLLHSITIDYNGSQVKEYVLTYQPSGTTGRDLLAQVQECAASTSNCLSPTTINYQAGSAGVSSSATVALSSSASSCTASTGSIAHYDFNGDGYPDLLYASGGTCYVAFGSASGYGAPVSTGLSVSVPVLAGDLLGTGKAGILADHGGTWYYYTWNGSSFVGTSTGLAYDSTAKQFALADINEDRLPDLVTLYGYAPTTVTTRLNTSSGGTPSFSSTAITAFTDEGTQIWARLTTPDDQFGNARFFDFNGDGRQDIVLQDYECGGYYMGMCLANVSTVKALIAQTDGTFSSVALAGEDNANPPQLSFANVNSDACTDLFIQQQGIEFSACDGNAATTLAATYPVVAVMDWNGDGLADLIENNGGTLYVQLATGNGFGPATATALAYNSGCTYVVFDANGDGLDDLGCASSQSGMAGFAYYAHNGAGQPPDLLSTITDGYGNSVSPTYVSMVQAVNTNYFPGNDAQYPYENYLGPMYLVANARYSDPSNPGGSYLVWDYYSGAWMNLQGRGFAGFGAYQTYDTRNDVYETWGYDRAFPYTGMVTSDYATQNNNASETIFNVERSPAETVLDGSQYNQRYFPYISDETRKDYEVGGPKAWQLITTTTTSYGFDDYGNATSVVRTVTDNDSGSPYAGQSWTTTTSNTPNVDTTHWCLTLFTQTQVAYTSTKDTPSVTRTQAFSPDTVNCRYTQVITEPSSAQ